MGNLHVRQEWLALAIGWRGGNQRLFWKCEGCAMGGEIRHIYPGSTPGQTMKSALALVAAVMRCHVG
jgi:hypothetical protein